MRVLLTNDDGPLNDQFSGYIRPFVQVLKRLYPHWELTVCVPHVQKSWIGKAHLAGKKLSAQFLYSKLDSQDNSYLGPFIQPQIPASNSRLPRGVVNQEVSRDDIEWILIDGTPASCVNVGLHHLSTEQFDLVISGPNVGRNTSAAYITSSGTVGAAMEAVIAGNVKSVAVSWAYFDGMKNVSGSLMEMASKRSLQIIDHLYQNWDPRTDFYSINVPLVESLSYETKAIYTSIWDNRWGPIFSGPHIEYGPANDEIEDGSENQMISFDWAPNFKSHTNSKHHTSDDVVDKDVVEDGKISVTGVRSTYLHSVHLCGELPLQAPDKDVSDVSFVITINPNDYIHGPLKNAIAKWIPNAQIVTTLPAENGEGQRIFHYGDYEDLGMERLASDTESYFANSYIYRKALIRKHYLTQTINHFVAKNPGSILSRAYLESFIIDLDYAEFLDDALDENWELRQELESEQYWWIVKPSMSDKGQGIRVFKTIEDLQAIFDSFDDDDIDDEGNVNDNNKVVISQLRHFVIQRYLERPLLLPSMNNRKFHIRCYISCKGALKVYVYDRMLALFAPNKFETLDQDRYSPTSVDDLACHLTNTCLQSKRAHKDVSVVEFDSLNDLTLDDKLKIKQQIHEIAHDIFLAALQVNSFNFQPLPNAFETFGVDFLVDENLEVKLLEINAYPDFKQTGDDLKELIDGLFDHTIANLVLPLLQRKESASRTPHSDFVQVLDYSPNAWR
ncbi:hypothetical protein HG537_0B02430 [Torulaspora globosa]|uniref:Survival protein SurE-like phosphatase/nucleotidase domain-containing protein n=1 Tax=Torulaspora globosa TaxID=48254 RepID=A0A7H9HRC4_9SACH|nr:hypothetical protein HG537_0B02430 [Torulaspora sp. CBS 2947]